MLETWIYLETWHVMCTLGADSTVGPRRECEHGGWYSSLDVGQPCQRNKFAWSASRRSVPDFAASSSPIFLVVPKYDGIPWESAPEITDPQNYTGDCVRISEREKD
jgi:hypothetical protein